MIGIIIDATDGDIWLQHINDRPAIEYVIGTALACPYAHKIIVVAPMSMKAKMMGSTFRGSTVKPLKILGRTQLYYFYDDNFGPVRGKHLAALMHELDIIIEVDANCPCIPKSLINNMAYEFVLNSNVSFLINYSLDVFADSSQKDLESSLYDKGLGVIIYRFAVLAKALDVLSNDMSLEDSLSRISPPTYFRSKELINVNPNRINLAFDSRGQINLLANILDMVECGKGLEEAIIKVSNEQV